MTEEYEVPEPVEVQGYLTCPRCGGFLAPTKNIQIGYCEPCKAAYVICYRHNPIVPMNYTAPEF